MEASSVIVLLKLILAHIVSDFALQPKKMVDKKSEKKICTHILHSFIHAAFAYVILWNWALWYVPIVIFITHFTIDYLKTYCKGNVSKMAMFVADQIIHLTVIVILWFVIIPQSDICAMASNIQIDQKYIWAYFVGILLLLKPSSVVISNFTDKWRESIKSGLPNAGLWIGYFERLLIFSFIMMGWYEGIGFLLAAKSIFRFGELKNEDLKTTEYVLIGTFASFFIAVTVGLLVKLLIG